MPNLEHPSMKRAQREESPDMLGNMPVLATVMPPEQSLEEEEREIERLVQEQGISAEKVMSDPLVEQELKKKRTFEKLMFFNKPITKKIILDDMAFSLKILTPRESKKVVAELTKLSTEDQLVEAQNLILASAILEVDGVLLEDLYEGDLKDPLLKKFTVIQSWPQPFVNILNKKYKEFTDEKEREFSGDFLKDSQATDTTA